jgi:hypothetical protein
MNLDALIELSALLAPDLHGVGEKIRLAVDAPQVYRNEHAEVADCDDDDWLPNVALEEALIQAGRLAIIDWRATPDEVLAAFEPAIASARPALRAWTAEEYRGWTDGDALSEDDANADRFTRMIARRLEQHELRCLNLGEGSDTYSLALVRFGQFARAVECAENAGFEGPGAFAESLEDKS